MYSIRSVIRMATFRSCLFSKSSSFTMISLFAVCYHNTHTHHICLTDIIKTRKIGKEETLYVTAETMKRLFSTCFLFFLVHSVKKNKLCSNYFGDNEKIFYMHIIFTKYRKFLLCIEFYKFNFCFHFWGIFRKLLGLLMIFIKRLSFHFSSLITNFL